jgi:hypothetical protein
MFVFTFIYNLLVCLPYMFIQSIKCVSYSSHAFWRRVLVLESNSRLRCISSVFIFVLLCAGSGLGRTDPQAKKSYRICTRCRKPKNPKDFDHIGISWIQGASVCYLSTWNHLLECLALRQLLLQICRPCSLIIILQAYHTIQTLGFSQGGIWKFWCVPINKNVGPIQDVFLMNLYFHLSYIYSYSTVRII